MKNILNIILVIIGILVGLILLDTIQARIFNNSPIIRVTKTYSNFHKKNIGIFVETDIYEGVTQRTYFKWEKKTLPIREDKDDLLDQLNEVNDMIIETFMNNNIRYDNYCYNYVDTQKKVVIVGLENNTKKEQEWFKKNIVDSDLIEFEEGSKATTSNTPASVNLACDDVKYDKVQELKENRTVYFASCTNELNKETKEELEKTLFDYAIDSSNKKFDEVIEEMSKEMNKVASLWDGGTTIYRNKKMTMIVCNTIDGNKDVYFGNSSMEYDEGMCK